MAFAGEDSAEASWSEERCSGAAVGRGKWCWFWVVREGGLLYTIPLQPTPSELPGARQVPILLRIWYIVAFCVVFTAAIGKGSHANG